MNEEFKILVKNLEPTLQRLISSPFIDLSSIATKPRLAGVYVFYEGKTPIYVGRTRNFRSRLRSHYNITNSNMGSFAFLIACETYGRIKPAYKKEGGRKDLHSSAEFRPHLKKGERAHWKNEREVCSY